MVRNNPLNNGTSNLINQLQGKITSETRKFDHHFYFNKLSNRNFIYLLIYGDDMLISYKSMIVIERLKNELGTKFEIKDLGKVQKKFGMKIARVTRKRFVELSQK